MCGSEEHRAVDECLATGKVRVGVRPGLQERRPAGGRDGLRQLALPEPGAPAQVQAQPALGRERGDAPEVELAERDVVPGALAV